MNRKRAGLLCVCAALLCLFAFAAAACSSETQSGEPQKVSLRVIIVPKFEIGEMSGDFPGEAQLFYEEYCKDCEEAEIPNMPATGHFYVNEDSGVGVLVTGSGKTAAGLSLTALLSSDMYDCSDAYIVSVGCAGGNGTNCTFGDVVVVTAACDYDLGHHVDAHEKENDESPVMWFPDDSFAGYGYKQFNKDLADKAYELIKGVPLRTTDMAMEAMRENYTDKAEEDILPSVKKGTAMSGDNYWKGVYSHETANYIANYYKTEYPYTVCEMEETAIANAAECFGMTDRIVSIRTVVNMDLFLNGETPESTWGVYDSFGEMVSEENEETLDIFEPAMHNLFDTGKIIIDELLSEQS